MTHRYTAYGVTLNLPFECPPLVPSAHDGADAVCVIGEVPRALPAASVQDTQWDAAPQRFLYRGGRRVGRFLVEEGARITLRPGPDVDPDRVAFVFLHVVLAALLRQRGLLVLHANAVTTGRGAIAITGVSGAGKSTTLAALLARGCAMLADDVAVVGPSIDGAPQVLPGIPQFHLTEEAADRLSCDTRGLPRRQWHRMKIAVPANGAMAADPAPLRRLYVLDMHDDAGLQVRELRGAARFAALQDAVYGPMLAEEHHAAFDTFQAVTAAVPVVRIARPADRWSVDDVVEVMLRG